VGAVTWSIWTSTLDSVTWNLVWLGTGLGAALQGWFESRNGESSPGARVSRVLGAAVAAAVLGVALVFAFAAVQIALDPNQTWG
jgi:hypothetical protein